MEIIKLNARSRDSAETTIRYHLGQIEDRESEETSSVATATEELSEMSTGRGGGGRMWSKNRALVIDGKTLIYILDRRANLQVDFFKAITTTHDFKHGLDGCSQSFSHNLATVHLK